MKKEMKYRKGVFIVTYRVEIDGKMSYIILKRKLHWKGWEFPKGGVEKQESLIEAVRREVKEECGMKVINIKNHHVKGKFNYDKKSQEDRKYFGQSYNLFSAEVKDGTKKVKIDKREHSDYKWLRYGKALKMLTWENQRKALRLVNGELKK